MYSALRSYIRESLRVLLEKEKSVLKEPDERDEDKQDEMISLGGMAVRGATGPMGDAPADPGSSKKKKKKSDSNSRSFGGGDYKE